LAAAHPHTCHQLLADWVAIQEATQLRVCHQRGHAATTSWRLWTFFCHNLGVDVFCLPSDPIPLLQVFAQRLRAGTLCASRRRVSSRTVEDTVCGVAQTYASMGAPDPHMNVHGALDFRLTSLYQAWSNLDAPPSRVKPLPLSLVTHVVTLAHQEDTPAARAAADCLVLGFIFMLRPGEYLGFPNDTLDTLFRLSDVILWIGARALDLFTCPIADLQDATFVTLTFTRQKNGVRNETIGHGRSHHPTLCSVLCLVSRVLALQRLQAPASAPINAYGTSPASPLCFVQPADLTRRMRLALAMFPNPAFAMSDVSARSTRAGGAMALLCAGVDNNRIRLIGRWRSDEHFRYLHMQAQPVMTGISAAMFRGGSFRLASG
jgi:hypothetical protein